WSWCRPSTSGPPTCCTSGPTTAGPARSTGCGGCPTARSRSTRPDMTENRYDTLDLVVGDGVATIRLINRSRADAVATLGRAPVDMHWELGTVLTRLRED